jgi:endonuclease YncB( thermonuclease family)
MYEYNAEVIRIVDGDTIVLRIDLGFKLFWKVSCRLHGINCPEIRSKDSQERIAAKAAKDFTASELPIGSIVLVYSVELDKYGRPLVDVFYGDKHLNVELVSNNHAKLYML